MPKQPDSRPTMGDIARAAGVSQMTVSRVMRGTGQTSDAVHRKVMETARALGYVPNRLATALRDETTPLVAVILPTLENRVFAEVLNGVTDTLSQHGLQPVFGVTEYDAQREEELLRDLLAWRPRGVILPGLEHTDASRAALTASNVRVAEVMDIDGAPVSTAFGLSHRAAGAATARHMLDKGHRRFAWVGPPSGHDLRADKRREGFVDTLRRAGAELVADHAVRGASSMLAGREATQGLLSQPAPPRAIYYANDDLAAGGMMHGLSHGLSMPGDFALAGFNDLPFLAALPLRLTTVSTPRHAMGAAAAEHVISDAPPRGSVDLGFTLIAGETC